MSKEVNAAKGQAAGRDIINKQDVSVDVEHACNVIVCNGSEVCPLKRGNIPQSAQDEAEFHKLTGIRTGSYRVRELLEQFRAKHNLSWRGRGISRLWRERKLEYDDARDCLRVNSSRIEWLWGWFCSAMCFLFLALMALLVVSAKPTGWKDMSIIAGSLLAYSVGFFCCIEYMVIPEAIAIRLRKKELLDNR